LVKKEQPEGFQQKHTLLKPEYKYKRIYKYIKFSESYQKENKRKGKLLSINYLQYDPYNPEYTEIDKIKMHFYLIFVII
jgi:hypothetical protein